MTLPRVKGKPQTYYFIEKENSDTILYPGEVIDSIEKRKLKKKK